VRERTSVASEVAAEPGRQIDVVDVLDVVDDTDVVDDAARAALLAKKLAPFTALVVGDAALLGLDNQVVDELVSDALRRLVASRPLLARRAAQLSRPMSDAARTRATVGVERSLKVALRARPDVVDALWPLLGPTVRQDLVASSGSGIGGNGNSRLGRYVAASLLTGVIAATVAAAVVFGGRRFGTLTVADLVLVWMLSFLPGWLYIRFIGQRAGALWDEYVLNLHRLGLDRPEHLPQPPVNSVYFADWLRRGGAALSRQRNIYRQKFDAYYGRHVSEATSDARIRTETLFPVGLATIAFAIGWTGLFWSDSLLDAAPTSTEDVLAFGFLGAYLFNVQMLSRRFFQSDLKPSAYTSAVLRIIIVMITVTVLHQLPAFEGDDGRKEAIVAFVVGMFPLVGLQALNRVVAVTLRAAVPTLRSPYPLSDLDGLNIWYEARLLEEGIEDMQNLVSANTVEVLLHTRVPIGRLVDWYDQAHLYLHLGPRQSSVLKRRRDAKEGREHARTALADFGIRSATSFVKAFPANVDDRGEPADPLSKRAARAIARRAPHLPPAAMMTISGILNDEPALNPVRSWRASEVATRQPAVEPAQDDPRGPPLWSV
jgi:hypothetical protein